MARKEPMLDLRRYHDEPAYELPGTCSNCDWAGGLTIPKGLEAPSHGIGGRRSQCPKCGCRTVGKVVV